MPLGTRALRAWRGLGEEGALRLPGGRVAQSAAANEAPVVPEWRGASMPPRPEPLPQRVGPTREFMPEDIKLGRQQIADKYLEAGITPEAIDHYMRTGDWSHVFHSKGQAPRAEMLIDIDPQAARFAGSQMRMHGEASRIGQSRLTARQTGETPSLGVDPDSGLRTYPKGDPNLLAYRTGVGVDVEAAGQRARAAETLHRATLTQDMRHHGFGATAEETADRIIAGQKAASDTGYGNLRMVGRGVDLQQEPALNSAVDELVAEMNRPGLGATRRAAIKDVLDEMAPGGQIPSYIDDLDKGKRIVDESIRLKLQPGASQEHRIAGRAMEDAREKILNAMNTVETDGLGEMYSSVRALHAEKGQLVKDLQLGEKLRKGEATIEDYLALGRDAQKRARHGFVGQVLREMSDMRPREDIGKLFDTPAQQRMLRGILDNTPNASRDQADKFFEYLTRLGREQPSRQIAYGGSQTAERIQDDKLADVLHRFTDIFRGGLADTGARGAEYAKAALVRALGHRPDVAASIVNDLTSANPVKNREAAAQFMMLMGRGRMGRLADILEAHAARHGQKAIGGVHVSGSDVSRRD
jgi:hypothetical protein